MLESFINEVAGKAIQKGVEKGIEKSAAHLSNLTVRFIDRLGESDKSLSEYDKPLNNGRFNSVLTNDTSREKTEGNNNLQDNSSERNDGQVKQFRTINEHLEGNKHPETGVEYHKVEVIVNGEKIEAVVPKFDSQFDAQLPPELYEESDAKQFRYANQALQEAVEKDPELRSKFTKEQLEQIMNGDTPDGYTWHHDAEPGKLQLIDTEVHYKTRHTGGKAIWGGGSENR